jgi:hypothetical protein
LWLQAIPAPKILIVGRLWPKYTKHKVYQRAGKSCGDAAKGPSFSAPALTQDRLRVGVSKGSVRQHAE